MKLAFKTLTQDVFHVEAALTDTIKKVKEKIQSEKGAASYPVEFQKLIYCGKVLTDEMTVGDAKLDEKRFIVIMVTLPRKAPTPSPTPTPTPTPTAVPPPTKPRPTTPSPSRAGQGPQETPAKVPGNGPEYERVVTEMMAMGYPREQVVAALEASNHVPDRAADFLLAQVPDTTPTKQGNEKLLQPPPALEEEPDEDAPLDFLRRLPAFAEMRRMIRQNPNNLDELLQLIQRNNPRLYDVVMQHQVEFMEMLYEGDNEPQKADREKVGGQPGKSPSGANQKPPGMPQVTPTEREAIERMKSMGFPEPKVLEAFFACDKKEDLAINLLLQQSDEKP